MGCITVHGKHFAVLAASLDHNSHAEHQAKDTSIPYLMIGTILCGGES